MCDRTLRVVPDPDDVPCGTPQMAELTIGGLLAVTALAVAAAVIAYRKLKNRGGGR